MVVAHAVSSASHASGSFSVNQTAFSWTHTTTINPQGVLVLVFQGVASADAVGAVMYGGVTVPAVAGGRAVDTATEPGSVAAYFLGSGVPTTDNPVVQITRTSNATTMWAVCVTVTAAADTEVAGVVLLQENGTLTVQSVDDGSTGTDSVRYAGAYYGGSTPAPAGTGSTLLHSDDAGAYGWSAVRETTAGQGARNVGFTQATSDDRAAVHLAIREVAQVTVLGAATASFGFTGEASGATGGGMAVGYRSSSTSGTTDAQGTSRTVPVPAGAAAGDIVIVAIEQWWDSGTDPVITWPSGFLQVVNVTLTGTGPQRLKAAWKRLTGSDTGSYSMSWTGTQWNQAQAICITGALASGDPIDFVNTATSASGTAVPTTSGTATGLDFLVHLIANENSSTKTPPTGHTEVQDANYLETNYKIATATGTQTASGATQSVSSLSLAALIAIKPAAGGGGTVAGAAIGSFGFTGTVSGIPRTRGAAAASISFAATAHGVDRAVGAALAALGFTGTAAGTVGSPPVAGIATAAFGFTASSTGIPRTRSTATGVFGFTATAGGVDRARGAAVAAFGFTTTTLGVDRAVGAATGTFGFTTAVSGRPRVRAVAAAVFGFTATTQGFAGTPPVTGSATGLFGFTAAALGQPRTRGAALMSFGFAGSALGRPRAVAVTIGIFGFQGAATGHPRVLGAATTQFGFTAVMLGFTIGVYTPPDSVTASVRVYTSTASARGEDPSVAARIHDSTATARSPQ